MKKIKYYFKNYWHWPMFLTGIIGLLFSIILKAYDMAAVFSLAIFGPFILVIHGYCLEKRYGWSELK